MATLEDLVARARRMLRGSRRELFNTLKNAAPAAQTFFDLTHPVAAVGGITEGDYLGVGTEISYVVGVDQTINRVMVERAVDGTVAPVSQPAGTKVEVNWRWFTHDLVTYLADEVRSWPDGIFVVADETVNVPVSDRVVDLPLTRFRYALKATAKRSGRSEWVSIPASQFRVTTDLPTSQFPSGNALTVSGRWAGTTVQVHYARGFDLADVEDLTTDPLTIGLSEHLFDAAVYGIAWRALAGAEGDRSNAAAQPEPREADEVDAFDAMRTASAYKAIRDQRLEEEKRRLRQLYPLKVA